MPDDRKPSPRAEAANASKRRYQRPALIEYGPISKLTRSGGLTRSESASPMMRLMACL